MMIATILIFECGAYSLAFIGEPEEGSMDKAMSSTYVVRATEFRRSFDSFLPNDNLSRIKDCENLLNTNYPFILEQPSLSNWTHAQPLENLWIHKVFGYSQNYTRLCDSNGTIFSDTLFGEKYAISKNPLDGNFYKLLKETNEGVKLYENKYTLPFGIVANSAVLNEVNLSGRYMDNHNYLYSLITGSKETLIADAQLTESIADPNNKYIIASTRVDGEQLLYLQNSEYLHSIYVNDKPIYAGVYDNSNNMGFPTGFNNGLLCLGSFKDADMTIRINYSSDTMQLDSLDIGMLDMEKFRAFVNYYQKYDNNAVARGSKLTLTVGADIDNAVLFCR